MGSPLPQAALPVLDPQVPVRALPEGACDAHVHMLAAEPAFPLWEHRVEDPASGTMDEWLARLRQNMAALGVERTVIVHSILYGADNAVTLESLRRLGPDVARGIGLVTDTATEAELDHLRDAGVMGVRLNYVHGGVLSWNGVKRIAPMLAERGMHVQMLMNTHAHMVELAEDVRALPVPVVFDHLGWPDLSQGIDEAGFATLRALVSEGHCWVKLSAPYRVCSRPYAQAEAAIRSLLAANSERCLWGSDWPHIMLGDAVQPDAGELLNQFLKIATEAQVRQVLVDGPVQLYGF